MSFSMCNALRLQRGHENKSRENTCAYFHDLCTLVETLRFEDQDDYEYEIWLKVFSRILKIYTPRKALFYHFSL